MNRPQVLDVIYGSEKLSKQMRSPFDFERVCKNCKFADSETGSRYDYFCIKPNVPAVEIDDEEKDSCEDWETKVEHAPRYLVDKNGKILGRTK